MPIPVFVQVFLQALSVKVEEEAKLGHYTFHFVLKFLILVRLSLKPSVEDRMEENLVPRYAFFLVDLQTFFQKIYSFRTQVLTLYLQRNILDIID